HYHFPHIITLTTNTNPPSLHDALPISGLTTSTNFPTLNPWQTNIAGTPPRGLTTYPFDAIVAKLNPSGSALVYSTYLGGDDDDRSEEHTSELQSRVDLVCRLLLEKNIK